MTNYDCITKDASILASVISTIYEDAKVHWCDYSEVQKWLESEVKKNA